MDVGVAGRRLLLSGAKAPDELVPDNTGASEFHSQMNLFEMDQVIFCVLDRLRPSVTPCRLTQTKKWFSFGPSLNHFAHFSL